MPSLCCATRARRLQQSLLSSARISKIGDCVGIKIGPSLAKAKNVNISFLNLDLDAFLGNVAHSIAGDERRDPDHYKPWREAEVRAFLENQCHLKTSRRVPGRFFVHHDQAFDFWRELVARHQTQIDLVHVDAHADLGFGDASWVHIVSELLRLSVAQRSDPPRGSRFLNAGSYIAYALAAR